MLLRENKRQNAGVFGDMKSQSVRNGHGGSGRVGCPDGSSISRPLCTFSVGWQYTIIVTCLRSFLQQRFTTRVSGQYMGMHAAAAVNRERHTEWLQSGSEPSYHAGG